MVVLRSSTVAACAISVLIAVMPARAESLALDVELPQALQACVSAGELEAAYQRALAAYGGENNQPSQLQVAVRSARAAAPNTTVLQLTASRAGQLLGTRELAVQARDCATLPDALGLVLALLTRDAPTPAQPQPPPPPSAAVQTDAPEPPFRPQRAPEANDHVALGIGAGAFFGVLPSAAPALQLQAATPGEPLSLRLKAGMLWPQAQRVAEGIVDARSYELSLEACAGSRVSRLPRLVLRICAGPRLGLMYASGREFRVRNQGQREFLMYIGLLPEAAVRLTGQTWLQLAAGAAVAAVRPRFEIGVERESRLVETVKLDSPALLRAELSLSVVQIF